VESGFGVIVLEMGIGGLILWFVMSFAILISAWRVVKKLRGSPWFPLAFVIFWYAGLLLFPLTFNGLQPYQDFVLNAYFWLLLGILFRLPSIALSAQYTAAAPLPQTYNPWMR
jgi:H+/Cl- antiporter ClcA